jgi:ankyrin repeat protein
MTTAGRTPLHNAALERGEQLAELLAQGAAVNATDAMGRTPLHNACQKYMHEHVLALLAAGADAAARDANGMTPLHYAVSTGFYGCIGWLIDAGSPIDATDAKGHTPLFHAAAGVCTEALSALLDAGADPGIKDEDGETAFDHLHPMLGFGTVDSLWREDARLNGPGRVARHLRHLIDHDEYLRILFVLNPAMCPERHSSASEKIPLPLQEWKDLANELSTYAETHRAWHSLHALQASGLPVRVPAAARDVAWTRSSTCNVGLGHVAEALIHDAANYGEGVPLLLRLDPEGCRPALDAAAFVVCSVRMWDRDQDGVGARRIETMRTALRALLNAGAAIEASSSVAAESACAVLNLPRDADGRVVLLAEQGNSMMARAVAGCVQDLQRPHGFTLLLRAAENCSELIEDLIGAGADVTAVDGFGRNALHLASAADRLPAAAKVVSWLLDAGIRPDLATPNGWRPLCLAASADVVAALVAGGASMELSADEARQLGSKNTRRLQEWISEAKARQASSKTNGIPSGAPACMDKAEPRGD